jgi:hypothetical protein
MRFALDPVRQAPELLRLIPPPQRIFFADPRLEPSEGYLVARCAGWEKLEKLLERYLLEQTLFTVRALKRDTREPDKLLSSRTLYLRHVEDLLANAVVFDRGQAFPEIFLLAHLGLWARQFPDIPLLAVSVDPDFDPARGEALKLRVFRQLHADIAGQLPETLPGARALWAMVDQHPGWVLERYREEPVPSPWPLGEKVYGIDGAELKNWVDQACLVARDYFSVPRHRALVPALYGRETADEVQVLCARELRALLPLSGPLVEVWARVAEGLVRGDCFRRAVDRVRFADQREGIHFLHEGERGVPLSEETRPLKFSRPGVVDFRVKRFSLQYDVREFSALMEGMTLLEEPQYRQALAQADRFQREILGICAREGLTFEKYMGGGGFITARYPGRALKAALHIVRAYRALRGEGFFFDRGLTVALHHSPYSMVPVDHPGGRHGVEFYGQGLVELDALVTDGAGGAPAESLVATLRFVEALAGQGGFAEAYRSTADGQAAVGVILDDGTAFGLRYRGMLGGGGRPLELVDILPEPPAGGREPLRPEGVAAELTRLLRVTATVPPPDETAG